MLKNYLKVAWRNFNKRKAYTLINVLGLATGISTCLLIVLYIFSELGYDSFHKNADNIYRVALERLYPGRASSYAIIPSSIGAAVQRENPEVKECTRLFDLSGNDNFIFRIGDKTYEEPKVYAADSNFFRVFTAEMITGNTATALMEHNSVVLNETTAIKLFGSATTASGKMFTVDINGNNTNFIISGVCKDWPQNSHFKFSMLISTTGLDFTHQTNYTGFSAYTYLLLNPNTSLKTLEAKLPLVVKKYVSGEIEQSFGQSFEEFQKAGNGYHYYLQPLKQIHLNSSLEGELTTNGSKKTVYIFSIVAIFILSLACINFINLSTARSVERAKEVGIRKTFGSEKKSLVFQFLFEAVLLSVISTVIAFALMLLLLPLFNQVTGKELSVSYFFNSGRIFYVILLSVATGIVAGFYPAVLLSSFKPILVLKGRFKSNKAGLLLRNSLVIFQFSISVILITATIIINRQMNFMLGSQLGFNKEHIIIIKQAGLLDKQTKAFEDKLLALPAVKNVSGTSSMPDGENFFGIAFQQVGSKESVTGRGLVTDENYVGILNLQLKQGRFFSKQFGTDTLAVVLNEKAVLDLGLKNPLGATLTTTEAGFNAPDGTPYKYTVVGVIKDFHYQSMQQQVAPLFITNAAKFGGASNVMAVQVNTSDFNNTISSIETLWKSFVPQNPFHYNFLDKTVAAQYHDEETARKVFTIFSTLAIFIACIGLLGLAAFITQQRTREIAIRKVLGANIAGIITMLSKDFLKLIMIAALIAFPVAWLSMHSWLQDFAYREELNVWVFILPAIAAALIALITISFQAIKAAVTNPVKSLRTE